MEVGGVGNEQGKQFGVFIWALVLLGVWVGFVSVMCLGDFGWDGGMLGWWFL